MREYLEALNPWITNGNAVAVARVIKTWGSSPRPIGSLLFINDQGNMIGSVSGGCVEGAVVKHAMEIIETRSCKKIAFGVSDEEAWTVGLSCGGSLEVYLEYLDYTENSVWTQLVEKNEKNESAILINSLEEGSNSKCIVDANGNSHGDPVSNELKNLAQKAYDERSHQTVTLEGKEYFIQVFPRKSQLLIIGAAHITVDLVTLGHQFGFETIVIDPRGYFTRNVTFTTPPDKILEAYPSEVLDQFELDAYTFCAILSHDPKIDDNALAVLLPSKVAYIGALGSKKNQEKRKNRLLEKGFKQSLIDKIHGPIGVNINAKSAREIALSVMAQIIEVKNQFK